MAKKLALIDPDLLVNLLSSIKSNPTPPPNPTLKRMNRLDDRLASLLTEDDADPNVRVKQINDLLSRYDTHHSNYKKIPQIEMSPPPAPPPSPQKQEEVVEEKNELEEDIVKSLPQTLRKKGVLLLRRMKNSNVSWDNLGRVTVNGTHMKDSNILDITHQLLRKRKNIEPAPSLREVYDELKNNNVPSELIPNPPLRRPQLVAARKRRRMDEEAQNEALKRWKSLKSSHS